MLAAHGVLSLCGVSNSTWAVIKLSSANIFMKAARKSKNAVFIITAARKHKNAGILTAAVPKNKPAQSTTLDVPVNKTSRPVRQMMKDVFIILAPADAATKDNHGDLSCGSILK